jgi:hypothetical protein
MLNNVSGKIKNLPYNKITKNIFFDCETYFIGFALHLAVYTLCVTLVPYKPKYR